ncbi:hypothetical protein [Weissella paramesenteroides]|uniref:hypothetical protein n=1 Tax=Weissella paramesenteroides TaxID=1249 RepID=UPI0013DADD1C|nr:hypothetical protein [Weissella paramesenteroides]NEZ88975.1 hypothetical protein [Weissella paramesenteroides]NFB03300.1 hypothetical protein [Weissella paramesenteroides]
MWKYNKTFLLICSGVTGFFIATIFLYVAKLLPNNLADWLGAGGTIGAVWLAVSYRKTKLNFEVDAVIRVTASEFGYKPKFEVDIFNINDPSVMIKDIEVIRENGHISGFLEDGPIVIKGFGAQRIESKRISGWITNMEDYNKLKSENPKINIILFGDEKRKFNIRFINEDGA